MKLESNKYLDELGIPEKYYTFNKESIENDKRYQIGENGMVQAELWNVDYVLACYIYSYLSYFKERHCSHPAELSSKEWNEILDEMIEGFKAKIDEPEDETYQETLARYDKVDNGLKLFAKWFQDLWD